MLLNTYLPAVKSNGPKADFVVTLATAGANEVQLNTADVPGEYVEPQHIVVVCQFLCTLLIPILATVHLCKLPLLREQLSCDELWQGVVG